MLGVIGLSNTVREHAMVARPGDGTRPARTAKAAKGAAASCEAPYPTRAQLYAAVNSGTSFPFGFGGAPGCNGLTPSQTNSIYGAPHVGPRGQGAGVNIAVFELSAYQYSDITHYPHTFFGSGYHPRLVDVNVDGGPLAPICPAGDTCPPDINGYAGDIEVDADIETQIAVSPAASHFIVYNAPNDFSGQAELDEYTAIASADQAVNADEYTPYGEYCTANANTPFSACGFSAGQTPPGWFGIGGTSLSSPLWSAIIANRDSFQGHRSGNINPVLYLLNLVAPSLYFHDITGIGQTTNDNGLYPTTPGYDEATGIGTPKMAAIITGSL